MVSVSMEQKIDKLVGYIKSGRTGNLTDSEFVGKTISELTPLYLRLTGTTPAKGMTQVKVCHVILDKLREIASNSK